MNINVGQSIRAAQAIRNITNTQMASDLGVTRQTVHYWRKIDTLNTNKITEISDYFGMDFYDFLKLGEM